MVLIILALVLVVLVGWLVHSAGWQFAAKRMSGLVLILFLVTFLTTWLLRKVPGDACITALGTGASEDAVATCRLDLGLDKNIFAQYFNWVGDVFQGDVIEDYKTNAPMTQVFKDFAPRSAWLFLYAQIIALVISVPLGVWSAYQAGRTGRRSMPKQLLPVAVVALVAVGYFMGWSLSALLFVCIGLPVLIFHAMRGGAEADTAVNTIAFMLLSIPVFVLGESLRYEFSIKRDWYDIVGYSPWSEGIGAHVSSVWLPAIVLGLAVSPVYLRLLRTDMLQNLQQDYVSVAKAKGMSNSHILLRHVLRPSTVTLLTVFGLNIAQLVNGPIVVEFIFDFDGMGSYLLDAVARRRFFAVQTIVAVVAVLFVLTNMIVDVIYTSVDPRVSVTERD